MYRQSNLSLLMGVSICLYRHYIFIGKCLCTLCVYRHYIFIGKCIIYRYLFIGKRIPFHAGTTREWSAVPPSEIAPRCRCAKYSRKPSGEHSSCERLRRFLGWPESELNPFRDLLKTSVIILFSYHRKYSSVQVSR